MAFESEAVSASGGDGMFPQHPKTGDFESLKGKMLAPPIAQPIESDSSHGGSARGYAPSPDGQAPTESIVVNTPMTGGGGTYAK
jgi:hypothetical protein